MTLGHARETLPSSSLQRDTRPDPQARKDMSVVLIDRQILTRHCLSRSFQEALPDLRVVAVANLAGLLDASRSLRSMDLMVFNIGDASVRDAEVLGQIAWLGAAIQCAAAGGTFVPASSLVRFAQDRQNGSKCSLGEASKGLFESLTPRELEVLALLREGKPKKVIAHELEIRESTVKVFVGRVLGKLHVSNRTQLALLARAHSGSAAPKGSDQR